MCTTENISQMCADRSARHGDDEDHVKRVLAFLEPVVSLQTQEDRLEKYKETWTRLNPAAEKEVWKPTCYRTLPIHM